MPERQPSLQQLTYFLASVEHGSFAAAAQSLYIAQPSLSDQIRRLEAVLGVRLFTRTNRRLQLTDAGRMVVPWARRVLADLDELTSAVRDVRELAGGQVAFGTFSSAHLYLLPQLTADFHTRHPDVRVRVQGLNSSEVAAAVRGGSLEAGLVQLPIDDQGLWVSAPVLTDTVVYVSADPARARSPVTVAELCRAPLILSEAHWARDDPLRRTLTERAQRAGVVLDPAFEVEFQTAAVEMAAGCRRRPGLLPGHAVARLPGRVALGAARPGAGGALRLRHPVGRRAVPGDPDLHDAGGAAHPGAAGQGSSLS